MRIGLFRPDTNKETAMEQTLYRFIKDLFTDNGLPIRFIKIPCHDWNWIDQGLRPEILGIEFSPDYVNDWFGSLSQSAVYHLTDLFQCHYTFFFLPDSGQYCIIGPLLFEEISGEAFEALFQKLSLPEAVWKPLKNYYHNVAFVPHQSFYETFIQSAAALMTGQKPLQVFHQQIPVLDLWAEDQNFHFHVSEHPLADFRHIELRYKTENIIFEAVSCGNESAALEAFGKIADTLPVRRLSNQLRDSKDFCISFDCILQKAAESAGVHPIYISEFSDKNICQIERLSSSDQCKQFNRTMITGYCNMVRQYNLKTFSLPIRKAITYINMEPDADLSLKALAARLGLNPNYLSTLFTKELGVSLTEYVNRCRVKHAKHLLLSTDLPIKKIAQLCGFTDIHYFTRMFKRFTPLTPKKYREQGISDKLWDKPYFIR